MGYLVLARKAGQSITIGDVIVHVQSVSESGVVRLAIDAPIDVPIVRDDAKWKTRGGEQ